MDKSNSVKINILRCRKLIEQQLNWSDDTIPTRREYEILVEKIFNSTGVLLSISTVRRIWNNDFKNLPHKSTLDALAEFAGYNDWQSFTESQVRLEMRVKKSGGQQRVVITSIFLIVIIALSIFAFIKYQPVAIKIAGPIVFDYYQKNNSEVPNIIVFEYDVRNIIADSFYIVESSNDYKRKKLNVKNGQLTSSYFHPGSYEAFLLADDSVVGKLAIEIMSNSWIAMIKYHNKPQNVPYYFYEERIIENGVIGVERKEILHNHINITNDIYLTISNTLDLGSAPVKDFIYKTRVKLDSLETHLSCPKIFVELLFENDICYIPLVHYGGQSDLQLKFGNTYLTSNDSNLSGFGCNIYDWQDLEIESNHNQIDVFINDQQVASFIDSTDMGAFKGFSFTFDGIGTVDFVYLSKLDNDTIYHNDFNKQGYVDALL